jgi:hypothetical protein
VARAVRASVRFDLAIFPVRPEAWFGYAMSRLSPGLVRRTTGPFRAGAAVVAIDRLPRAVRARLLPVRTSDTPETSDAFVADPIDRAASGAGGVEA